jgi:hypothetical protein
MPTQTLSATRRFFSRSHDAVIRVYDESGNVIETRGHKGEILERISKLGISRWHHPVRAPKDQSNRRKYMPGYAVWEIHSVMAITVQ